MLAATTEVAIKCYTDNQNRLLEQQRLVRAMAVWAISRQEGQTVTGRNMWGIPRGLLALNGFKGDFRTADFGPPARRCMSGYG